MSAIKKGAKKLWSGVKKYWKEILIASAVVFTAGVATVGLGAYGSSVKSMGLWKATGSTMWAGATSMAGSVGLGSGAGGSVASSAGMEGATLGTGAWAQNMGWAEPAAESGSQMAGMGPLNNEAYAQEAAGSQSLANLGGPGANGYEQVTNYTSQSNVPGGSSSNVGIRGGGGGGRGLMGDMAVAAAPSIMRGLGGYFAARGEEEAAKPKALWGVDMESGTKHQPSNLPQSAPQGQAGGQQPTSEAFAQRQSPSQAQSPQPGTRFTGPDGKQYEIGPDGRPREVSGQGLMSLAMQQPGHTRYGVG